MTAFVQRFLNVRRDEFAALFVSACFFFCVLTGLMLLRPARDALGVEQGINTVRSLFVGTAVFTLVANPIFGWLVSRFRRISFISATYGIFIISLVAFYFLLTKTPQSIVEASGRVFYIWYSVFNLFCTMVFWALMVDRYSFEQSKRLFGAIAVGGTVGAINGPWLAGLLAKPLGTPALLLVAAVFFTVALGLAWMVVWLQAENATGESVSTEGRSVIGGKAWDGITAVFRSRYLLGISAYMLILSVIGTLIYFTRLKLGAELEPSRDLRAAAFARADLITQVATLAVQLVAAGHFMRRFGVSAALVLLPLTVLFGFVSLAIIGTFTAVIAFDASFKAVQRAIMRPVRETLFTVVSREDKYKSKAFTDTFVFRGGDAIGAGTEALIAKLGMGLAGLASAAVPLAVAWGVLGLWLGRRQESLATSHAEADPVSESLAAPVAAPAK